MAFDVFDFLAKRAELSPDREAMREIVGGQQVTYAELDARASRAASLLTELGVRSADRVALLCRNRIEFFELLYACARIGAIAVPLNWRMPAAELAQLMDDCTPRVLLAGKEDIDAGQAAHGSARVVALDDGYGALRDNASRHPGRTPWKAEDIWYLLYTSGTTGNPKAVIQTVGMALANHVNITDAMGLRATDTTLNYLPLFHTGGINLTTLPALIAGGRVLMLPGFDVEQLVTLLRDNQLDNFFGVPAIYQALSLHPDFEQLDLGAVRSWGCGGAPLPDVLVKSFASRGVRVMNGMGMTETGPTVFLMDEANVERKIGSVGKPQLLSAVRIVQPDGTDAHVGEAGELWFSGPGITPGYYNRPRETSEALVDGWLRSGDLACRDEEGYYRIVGRLKDMYISGGENVYPAEVENVLASHPAILEAAVVGVPDDRWGEVGRGYLLPRPGAALPAPDALNAWCRKRLAAFKIPRQFVAVEDFPRTAAGKVQKHLLDPEEDKP